MFGEYKSLDDTERTAAMTIAAKRSCTFNERFICTDRVIPMCRFTEIERLKENIYGVWKKHFRTVFTRTAMKTVHNPVTTNYSGETVKRKTQKLHFHYFSISIIIIIIVCKRNRVEGYIQGQFGRSFSTRKNQ